MNCDNSVKLHVYGIFPEITWHGPSKSPCDSYHFFLHIFGFFRGTAWRHELGRQATCANQPSFWFLNDLHGNDEHLQGDASHFGTILRF